jgi:hypothetical protein
VTLCVVTFDCPHCGGAHQVTAGLVLERGPGQAGTVAQLWPGGDLPAAVAALLRDRVWCDGAAEYVALDPERVTVAAAGAWGPTGMG